MEIQKSIKFKIGEIGRTKEDNLDYVLENGLLALKDFISLSKKHKTTSKTELHKIGYKQVVKKRNLPACVVHQARERASEIMKSWKSNKRRLMKNIKMPEPKALRIRYANVNSKIIKTENKKYPYFISILYTRRKGKNNNRIYIPILANSQYQQEYMKGILDKTYKKGSIELVKKEQDYFFHIAISKEVHIPRVSREFNPIGIDVGINNLAVVNVSGLPKFFSGNRVIWKKKQLNKIKADLQSKHNIKLLGKIKGREERYTNWIFHNIARYIIEQAKKIEKPVIVMEDLRGILESTRVRKKQRYIHQTWAFRKLQFFIQHKADWEGIAVIYVNPAYTSQICPRCLSINQRHKHEYKCSYCGYSANSDYVASLNIRKQFFEDIFLKEKASINYTLNNSPVEQSSMIQENFQKSATKGVCNSP
jgi:IS605 OrfB family transposase